MLGTLTSQDANAVLTQEYYVTEAIYTLGQIILEMDDQIPVAFDRDAMLRRNCPFASKCPQRLDRPAKPSSSQC
jgi:hypothetical protein